MNKIYKVVWSKARGCYMVVSEIAKNTTKGCSSKKLLAMLIATGVLSAGAAGVAEAATDYLYVNDDHVTTSTDTYLVTNPTGKTNTEKGKVPTGSISDTLTIQGYQYKYRNSSSETWTEGQKQAPTATASSGTYNYGGVTVAGTQYGSATYNQSGGTLRASNGLNVSGYWNGDYTYSGSVTNSGTVNIYGGSTINVNDGVDSTTATTTVGQNGVLNIGSGTTSTDTAGTLNTEKLTIQGDHTGSGSNVTNLRNVSNNPTVKINKSSH